MEHLVDSHCHIQAIGVGSASDHTSELWTKLGLSADQVIERAHGEGVNTLICVGCDLEDSARATAFVKHRTGCFASIGIHPHEASRYCRDEQKKDAFAGLIGQAKVVAIGECGLDYFYNYSDPVDQEAILRFQLELAIEHQLPVIFHVREAFSDFWPIFDQYKGVRGVLHSFSDNQKELDRAIERGLFLGVNGIASFTKDPLQLAMYKSIPNSRLLLETDSPYLTPVPYRGSINEPKYVRTIVNCLSDLRGEGSDELAKTTSANAHLLFAL